MWNSSNSTGWMAFVLKEKLKGVKERLKVWNKEEYGLMEERITKLKEDIEAADLRGERYLLTENEVKIRKDNFTLLWTLLKAKDSLTVQRSRVKWLKEGDANTKFFHNFMKTRVNGYSMRALKVDGVWLQTPVEVRRAVVKYFTSHVSDQGSNRPRLDGVW